MAAVWVKSMVDVTAVPKALARVDWKDNVKDV
jgi:hypothetical protein